MALLVHAGVPARSSAELLRLVEREPGTLAAASSNSTAELALRQLLGTRRVVHVPYKGDAPALTDLVAGRVHMMVSTGANAAAFVDEGRLRSLATTAPGGELALDVDAWLGLFAPAGTPLERREALAHGASDGMADALVRQRLAAQGFEPEPLGPAAFESYFRDQHARFLAAARRIGMTMER
jgi:tripartite-type tricarboxylate transporter receptor subunit TctC